MFGTDRGTRGEVRDRSGDKRGGPGDSRGDPGRAGDPRKGLGSLEEVQGTLG